MVLFNYAMNQILHLGVPLNRVFGSHAPTEFLINPFLEPFLKHSSPFELDARDIKHFLKDVWN